MARGELRLEWAGVGLATSEALAHLARVGARVDRVARRASARARRRFAWHAKAPVHALPPRAKSRRAARASLHRREHFRAVAAAGPGDARQAARATAGD